MGRWDRRTLTNDERSSQLLFRTLHNTARVARNSVSEEVVAIERRGNAKFEDVAHLVAGKRGRVVYETGDTEHGIWWAGMSQGLVHDIPTCAELVARIAREARDIIHGRLRALVP